MAIAATNGVGKNPLNRPMDVTSEYIGYLYDSLVRRGYLKEDGSRGYRLSPKGREALLDFLHQNRKRVRNTIRALRELGIESSHEMDKIAKEAAAVK